MPHEIQIAMLVLQSIITLALIPAAIWGYGIGQKITRLESQFCGNGLSGKVESNRTKYNNLDRRVRAIEMHCIQMHNVPIKSDYEADSD